MKKKGFFASGLTPPTTKQTKTLFGVRVFLQNAHKIPCWKWSMRNRDAQISNMYKMHESIYCNLYSKDLITHLPVLNSSMI